MSYNFGSAITGEIQGGRAISGGWKIIRNYSKLFRALMENPAGNRKLWKNYAKLSHRGVFFAILAVIWVRETTAGDDVGEEDDVVPLLFCTWRLIVRLSRKL